MPGSAAPLPSARAGLDIARVDPAATRRPATAPPAMSIMRRPRPFLAATLALACLTSPLAAQDSSATPFRAGQWGMEFSAGNAWLGAGLLRFSSPTRAWLIDGRIYGSWQRLRRDVSPDTIPLLVDSEQENRDASISLGLGRRAYRPLGRRALRIVEGGVRAGVSDQYRRQKAAYEFTDRSRLWNAGVEGGIGAVIRITDDLTLGGLASASANYVWSRSRERDARSSFDSVVVNLEPSRLFLTLYF